MSDNLQGKQPASASRREFLKSSTAAVVGGAVVGSLSIARSAHAAGDDTLKIALIGCGGRGTGAANQALSTKGSVKLVALVDAFEKNVDTAYKSLKEAHGDKVDVPKERQFVGFDGYKNAIDSGIDVVVHATPPGFRPIHFAAAVKAGKHVFMEKPVAVDAPGVRMVLEAGKEAQQKGLAVVVGLQRHHQAHYLEAVKRVQDGAIGEIDYTRVYWNGGGIWTRARESGDTEMMYQMRNWYYFNWLCGDHIVEQHIHNIDVGNWLVGGHPVEARGMGGRQVRTGKEYGEIYDHHCVEFKYANGVRMFSQCRHIAGCEPMIEEWAHGTKGECRTTLQGSEIFGANPWKFPTKSPDPYQAEHDDFFASIRSGNPLNETESAAHSTMTAIIGRMATYSGKLINWNEAIESNLSLAPQEYSFQATPPVMPDANGFYPVAVPGLAKVI